MNQELRRTVIPALDAVMNGGSDAAVAAVLPGQRFKARRQARKYTQSYYFVPDNPYVVNRRRRFEVPLTKEKMLVDVIKGARRKASETVWENSVLPRLQAAGLN